MQALKAEITAVVDAISQPHDTPEAAAKAAIAALDQARTERVTYFAVLKFGSGISAFMQGYGPFGTKNQAVKAIEKHPAAPMATGMAVVPTANEQGFEELLRRVDTPPVDKGQWVEVHKDARAVKNGWKGRARERDAYL